MTTGEAARLLGVGLNTVKRWINSGDLQGIRTPGGHWRISKDGLYAFMQAKGLPIPGRRKTTPARVLIVDDDPSECTLLSAVLEQADSPLNIQCVHDGYTGLMRIGAWRPDVLVLDILMPGIDGLEVLNRIRADPDHDDMAIVVVTALFDRPDVVRAARSAGVAALLPKPVEARRLLDIVGACLASPVVCSDEPRGQRSHGR
ncbi:MAG: response regulator [Ferrovum sp.]|jgi:excisionase family DNA binding protein|nr:response regulator [Ferrovum sp.]NDU90266.1 response regulator [Ferrovum sp.]